MSRAAGGQALLAQRREAFSAALRSAYSQLRLCPPAAAAPARPSASPSAAISPLDFPCFYVLDGPVAVVFAAAGAGGRGVSGGRASEPWAAMATSTWVLRRRLRAWVRPPTAHPRTQLPSQSHPRKHDTN